MAENPETTFSLSELITHQRVAFTMGWDERGNVCRLPFSYEEDERMRNLKSSYFPYSKPSKQENSCLEDSIEREKHLRVSAECEELAHSSLAKQLMFLVGTGNKFLNEVLLAAASSIQALLKDKKKNSGQEQATKGGEYPPLPRVGPIGYASVIPIQSYDKTMTIGPRIPGVRDVALWTTDQMRAYVDADRAMRELAAPATVAVPDGYKLVPVEPTLAMIRAGRGTPLAGEADDDSPEDYRCVYRAMLAAAPQPPFKEGASDVL